MKSHDTPEKVYDLERLIFFSDGVFAIAITLLAIELRPPADWDGSLTAILENLAPNVFYYAISFIAVGAFWMSHRLIFRYVQRFSEAASWINIFFLLLIGLMPLANSLLNEHSLGHPHQMSLAAIEIYIGMISLLSFVVGFLWSYVALIAKLIDPRVTMHFKWITLLRLAVFPPVMCSASLWFGIKFGLMPAMLFVGGCAFVSGMIRSKPFGTAATEDASAPAP